VYLQLFKIDAGKRVLRPVQALNFLVHEDKKKKTNNLDLYTCRQPKPLITILDPKNGI
jgi:hypothetical protein